MSRTQLWTLLLAAAPLALGATVKLGAPQQPAPAATPTPTPVATAAPAPEPTGSPTPVATPSPEATSAPAPDPTPAPTPTPTPTVAAAPEPPPATVVSDLNVAQCLQHFAPVKPPYQRGDDAAANHIQICRRGYLLSLNASTHDPDWVLERLTPADLSGTAARRDNFYQDPLARAKDAALADYARSGYDRGHQAPAADAKFAQPIMDQSFTMTNMAPQVGIGFNRGAWKYLEEAVRAWVLCGGHSDLFVITGPIYGDSKVAIGTSKVAVPSAFFKIVYDPNSSRAVAFVLPNAKIGSTLTNLQDWVKPIDWVETETGLNFFPNWSFRQSAQIKTQPGTAWGHIGTCTGTGGD